MNENTSVQTLLAECSRDPGLISQLASEPADFAVRLNLDAEDLRALEGADAFTHDGAQAHITFKTGSTITARA